MPLFSRPDSTHRAPAPAVSGPAATDASASTDMQFHGDRRVGVSYTLYNAHNASGTLSLRAVGTWSPCDGCAFADRWRAIAGVPLVYSTADNEPPSDGASLGLMLRMSDAAGAPLSDDAKVTACSALLAAQHANQRDGTLAPEAEWPTLMHERLCGLSGG